MNSQLNIQQLPEGAKVLYRAYDFVTVEFDKKAVEEHLEKLFKTYGVPKELLFPCKGEK